MKERIIFKEVRSLFLVLVVCLIIFTGCSHSGKSVAKNDFDSSHISKDIPENLRVHIVKLHSSSSAERVYGAMMLGKAGRKAVYAVSHLLDIIKDNDKELMKPVIDALGQIGDRRAVDPLIEILSDRTSPYRADAAKALGRIGSSHAIDPLIAILSDRTVIDKAVTDNAVWALGEIRDTRTIEPLITALLNNPSAAAEALSKIDPEWQTSEKALDEQAKYIDMLKESSNDEMRLEKVVNALSKMGKPVVAPLFILMMDGDVNIRKSAARTLNELGWEPSSQMEKIIYFIADQRWDETMGLGEISKSYLFSVLKDRDKNVRKSAARVLKKLGWEPSSLDDKIKYLIASQRWGALVKIGEPSVGALAEILKDNDKLIRRSASISLVKIGKVSITSLIPLLNDNRVLTRKIVASTLNQLDRGWKNSDVIKNAIPGFIGDLNSNDNNVRASSAWALSVIGDERSVLPLIEALNDYDPGVRLYVTKALGEFGDKRATMPLISMLRDNDSAVRGYAALALGNITGQETVEPLLEVLKDKDYWPRECALKALKKIDPEWANSDAAKKTIPDIIASLGDENINIQIGAVKTLGDTGNKIVVKPLIEKLTDSDESIRNSVARALGKIGDSRAVEPLIIGLRNHSIDPSAAIYALGNIMDLRAIRPLISALDDDRAKAHAVRALTKITGERFGDDSMKWIEWLSEKCKQGDRDYCMVLKPIKY